MSATYADWNNVPAHIERKIRKIWNGSGTACWDKGWDRNNDPITIYKLADYCVARNLDYLTDEQKLRMFDLVASSGAILSNLLETLSFEIETVRVHDEIYHLPGIIVGTWPHCKMFGGMDESGYVHT
jgi:hypothetical protein